MAALDGKRALVCGGSRGIGRACAMELAGLGASVTAASRTEHALAAVVSELPRDGGQDHGLVVLDFADPSSVQRRVGDLVRDWGPIHLLVNNTGGPAAGPLFDASEEKLTQAFSQHLLAAQGLIQSLVPGMKEAGYGRIVNIISTSVIQPIMGLGVSNVVRGAMANWARTLAGELAPFGITVNSVLPGYAETDRLRSILRGRAEKAGKSYEEMKRHICDTIPLGRLADPKEIASAVGFLASPPASYVTGVNLPVDGGRTAVQ